MEFIPQPQNLKDIEVQLDVLFETLLLVAVVSAIVERALSVVFESRAWVARHKKKPTPKPLIVVIFSVLICYFYQIDIMAVLMNHQQVSLVGLLVSGALIAGGSKASIKLFRDVLDIQSEASRRAKQQ